MKTKLLKWIWVAGISAIIGVPGVASAGKIISIPSASGAQGFGGWNMENVEVETFKDLDGTIPTDTPFDEADGAYDPATMHFESTIQLSAATSTPMAILKGKDYPVGEPPGIKIINDDTKVKEGKPQNCIMTTSYLEEGYLDSATPIQTICSSGFQTHKRFKVNMQPASLDINGGAIDLVFNIEDDMSNRDYQVFSKINNYTGSRLSGFSVQVGTGVGPDFIASGDSGGAGLDKLSLWASTDPTTGIWDPEDMANFAHGLFGPVDNHFPEEGFFDGQRAYFPTSKAESAGLSDTFASNDDLTDNYTDVPPSVGGVIGQFGPWQYAGIEPYGIFHDDDADPTTDPALMAFWGDTNGSGNYEWMLGQLDSWAIVNEAQLNQWASDPLYYIDRIEDMLNLGLNYVVTVGDMGTTTFTLRIIPEAYTGPIGDPGYVSNPPPPLAVVAEEGILTLSPKPEFNVGDTLDLLLADGNTGKENINITLENLSTGETESTTASGGVISMFEVEGRIGLYEGSLDTSDDQLTHGADDTGTMYAAPGHTIRATYTDDSPAGASVEQTTAAGATVFYVIPIENGGAAVFEL